VTHRKGFADNVTDKLATGNEYRRQLAARQQLMLRQQMGGARNRGLASLRRILAQRNALDSGSLEAGVTNMENNLSSLLAQGTQNIGIQQTQGELDELNKMRDSLLNREMAERGYTAQFQQLQAQLAAQLAGQRTAGSNAALGALGNAAGQAAGTAFGNWLVP